MGLKEKHATARRLVYENIEGVNLEDKYLLVLILQKCLAALQTYRSDKKAIYKLLMSLGKKYREDIGQFIKEIGLGGAE